MYIQPFRSDGFGPKKTYYEEELRFGTFGDSCCSRLL